MNVMADSKFWWSFGEGGKAEGDGVCFGGDWEFCGDWRSGLGFGKVGEGIEHELIWKV